MARNQRKNSLNSSDLDKNNLIDPANSSLEDETFLVNNDSSKKETNTLQSTDEMTFKQHEDGSYSILNTSGAKIYDDVKNELINTTEYTEKDNLKSSQTEKQKRKKKDKKKTQKTEEKKTFLQKMRTLGILIVLGVFTGSGLGVWYFNSVLRSNVDYSALNAADYIQDVDETLARYFTITPSFDKKNFAEIAHANNITPLNLTAADNFVLAQYKAEQANSYIAEGYGSVFTMGIKQGLYSAKKFNGQRYTFESISLGMVSAVMCDSYVKGSNTVTSYTGKNATENSATWEKEGDYTIDKFKEKAGNMPNAVQPYIISDKTIINSSEITYNNETDQYSFEIELDKVTSVINYARQVRRTGGLGADPEFYNIKQTIVIDSDWNLVQIIVEESYSAVAFGMKVSCQGTLTMDYKFNCDVTLTV